MRVAVMKAFHFAHDWPNHYYEVWLRRQRLFECYKEHSYCSIIDDGPCINEVLDDVDRGVKDREGNDS